MSGRPRVVCIVRPTASGKSALALELAEALDAEIVSADSRQVYSGFYLGTAKPTPAERARVAHHCLDLASPQEAFDVARFRAAASVAIADIHRRGRSALIVGGTGLYLRVLLRGLCPAPPRAPQLRAVLARTYGATGPEGLHRALTALDAPLAARLHPRDAVRAIRGLEVALGTGRRLSDWQATHGFTERPYEALVVGLRVAAVELDRRIAARTTAMIAAGFADEVRHLLAIGVGADAPGFRTVGYREMRAHVVGQVPEDATRAAIVLATRRYAKRQRTWFRGEGNVMWRDPDSDRVRIGEEVKTFLTCGRIPQSE